MKSLERFLEWSGNRKGYCMPGTRQRSSVPNILWGKQWSVASSKRKAFSLQPRNSLRWCWAKAIEKPTGS